MNFADTIRARPLLFLSGLAAISLLGLFLFVPPIRRRRWCPRLRRRADDVRHPELLERGVEPAVHPGRRRWGCARVRGNLVSQRVVLGVLLPPASAHPTITGHPTTIGLLWDRLPMAIAFMAALAYVIEERIDERIGQMLLWPLIRARHRQPAGLDQDRRPAALCLGAVLSLRGAAADVLAAGAEVHRRGVLVRRGRSLCAGQAAGALRRRDLCRDRAPDARSRAEARRRAAGACYAVYLAFTQARAGWRPARHSEPRASARLRASSTRYGGEPEIQIRIRSNGHLDYRAHDASARAPE